MKPGSRLIALALPLTALAACNAPTDEQKHDDAPSLAQQACDRQDVQEVVAKEVKGILYKQWFQNAGGWALLIDPSEQFKQARASFHDITADPGAGASTARVVCRGILQIDESSETYGQAILQLRKLRWSIDFGETVDNPQSSAFSIVLDRGSMADDVRINGQPAETWRQQQNKARSSQSENTSADTQDAASSDDQSQDEREIAAQAAQEAETAAQDAQSAAEEAERDLKEELAQ